MRAQWARGCWLIVASACAGIVAALSLATALGATETSPPAGYLRAEQDAAAASYTGSWVIQSSTSSCSYSGGTATNTASSGSQANFTFTGTAVRWIGYQDSASGIADVYIDGTFQTSVDTYSLNPVCQSMIFAVSGLANGPHTLTITATGTHSLLSLGNSVWVDAFDFQPQPTAAMTAPANGATVSGTATVSASASENGGSIASVQFKLDGANLGTAVTAVPYSVSWDTTKAANGSHTLAATATDTVGNSFTASSVTVTVSNDTSPPAVSMTAPANGATVSGTTTVSANASDTGGIITSVQFKLDGANLGPAVTAAPYSASWDTTKATNASHTLTAIATDSGGNSTTATPVTVTVSNIAVQPMVTLTAPANGATVSGTTTVSASASESGGSIASVQFKLDGANLGSAVTTAPYLVSWDTTKVTNGSHTLTAVATDPGGKSATSSAVMVTVSNDSSPPVVSMTAPANGATVTGTVTVSATASDSDGTIASVQFKLDGADLGSKLTAAPYSISWNTATAANGSHSLTATATDSGGNGSTASIVTVTVSNSGPQPTVTMTAPSSGATVSGTITVSADAAENGGSIASVQFELDGTGLGAAVTTSPYHVSWDTTATANGSHRLTAVVTDAGGHTATAAAVTVTVSNGGSGDTTPPTVSLTAPADGSTVSGSVTVFANASDDTSIASVQFTLDGANLGAAVTTSPYHVSWDTTTAANGNHTLSAVATDSSGNTASASPVTVMVSNGNTTTTTRMEETSPAIAYSGSWIQTTDTSLSGGGAEESNAANSTATLTFTGVAVTWISYRCDCTAGIAQVSVDGGAPTQVDTYAVSPQTQAPVFTASGLQEGLHTLKITVTGNRDPAGNAGYLVVDAFDVTDDPAATQDPTPAPSKSGGGAPGLPVLGLLLVAAVVRGWYRRWNGLSPLARPRSKSTLPPL